MIYVTGDVHGNLDYDKFYVRNFPEQKHLVKKDYVIVCGDFGLVWDNSPKENKLLDRMNDRRFTTLFVQGNHENTDLLKQYRVEDWNGGKVRKIRDSVINLMHGQVYTIDGMKFFTMGGGSSVDKEYRIPGISWWADEIPSDGEFAEAKANLDKVGWKVDYIITHTTSMKNMVKMNYIKEDSKLNKFFDMLQECLEYKIWYFGHFHSTECIDKKHRMLYRDIVRLGE